MHRYIQAFNLNPHLKSTFTQTYPRIDKHSPLQQIRYLIPFRNSIQKLSRDIGLRGMGASRNNHPHGSDSVQREATSFSTSSPKSNGILQRAAIGSTRLRDLE